MNPSPANRQGLFSNLLRPPEKENDVSRIEEITAYRCRDCYEIYEDEDEANKCCAPAIPVTNEKARCPVCLQEAQSLRDATDCCLWKDIDAHTRWRIADQVEAGSTWAEAMGIH